MDKKNENSKEEEPNKTLEEQSKRVAISFLGERPYKVSKGFLRGKRYLFKFKGRKVVSSV